MEQTTTQINEVKDRVKLPLAFDVTKMQEDIDNLKFNQFLYYDVMPLRAPAFQVDPSIPQPPPADDYADGSWTDWKDTNALKQCPYLMSIVDFFREHTKVTLVRLLRLEAGADLKEHTDPTLGIHIEKSVVRLTIPIQVNDQVTFYLNQKPVPMKPGECWYLRLTDPHSITNEGNEERINLTIDMIPNEWVTDMILKAQEN